MKSISIVVPAYNAEKSIERCVRSVSAQIRALKCYLYLCWQFNPTIMYSSEDLERFYFQYQTEAVPHGVSLQSFCSTNNVPYNLFHNGTRIPAEK